MWIEEFNSKQSKPFVVTVGNSTETTTIEVYSGGPNDKIRNETNDSYWIVFDQPRLISLLRIEHRSTITNVMTVCEVFVYDTGTVLSSYVVNIHV